MAISDGQFRTSVVGGALGLAAIIGIGRFCGSVSLPPRPVLAIRAPAAQTALTEQAAAAPAVYEDHLARDASTAGLAVPTLDDMTRTLPYRFDDKRHVLEVGEQPVQIAGLALVISRAREGLVLAIENTTGKDVAYHVVSAPVPTTNGCNSAPALPFNAVVLARGAREVRVECAWRTGMALAVTRVELVELPPLSTWYLSQVPAPLLGIEPRIARGHRSPNTSVCSPIASHALESGLEHGEIVWRDLVDFYARYRCQTYQFPLTYRAVGRND
ncbi:MAG: hypothetical protein WKG01_36030 [Kofleriaceae bacterium]